MKKVSTKNLITIIAIAMMSVAMLFAVIFLMSHVRKLLDADVSKTMVEIVNQNRDVINNKLNVEVNNLQNSSKIIEERFKNIFSFNDVSADKDTFKEILIAFCEENKVENYFITDAINEVDPNNSTARYAYFADGTFLDVHARSYYKKSVIGIPNISERIQSRKDGRDIFVISVPLYQNKEIIGTVQKWFTLKEMYDLCSVTLFSSQGKMNIINRDGYVMISSDTDTDNANIERVNYFDMLFSKGNSLHSQKLKDSVANDEDGSMEIVLDGIKYYSAYTPIPEVHDWFLITSVSVDKISANANSVVKMFYIILSVVVLMFAVIMFFIMYTQTKQKGKLQRIAFVDRITGGKTYNKFLQELSETLHSDVNANYGILVFDIDNFKYINRYYGFDFGDNLLRRIYDDFNSRLLPNETVARVSNDQFIALLRDCDERRINELLEFPTVADDVRIYLSAGLYRIEDPTESPGLMLDKAATAAQKVKGATQLKLAVYDRLHDKTVHNNEQMKRKIEQALKNGEIIPFYQPKVNITTGQLVGAEALARWKSSDGKLVSPIEFIPLSEKTGQIVDIDAAIFDQVLNFLQKRLSDGAPCLPVSVNFSRMNLLGDDFIHRIVEKIEAKNVPPNLIQIELTESLIFENHQIIIDFVEHLHEHGLLVCIDDFGSGYSSLNMLKDIPIDVLKIDKVFLDDTKNPERQLMILSGINDMATKLNMEVVVEGVETELNVTLMKKIGCFVAQGYFYARPMDESSFTELYKKGFINNKGD